MITGDNALTAAFIGQQLKYGNGPSVFAESLLGEGRIAWCNLEDQPTAETKSAQELKDLAGTHLLCITGNLLDEIFMWKEAASVIETIHVFSRTSPT